MSHPSLPNSNTHKQSSPLLLINQQIAAIYARVSTTDQADSAIDQLNTVRGQKLAILFKEAGPRLTKVSIRSRDLVDAAELAAKFGGGGHRRAAGVELAMPLKDAETEVLAEVRARMNGMREVPQA